MGCCGRARANLGVAYAANRQVGPEAAGAAPGGGGLPLQRQPIEQGATVTLRYLGSAAVTVRGPVTGRTYAFCASAPRRSVDPKDAIVLLRTAYFRPG